MSGDGTHPLSLPVTADVNYDATTDAGGSTASFGGRNGMLESKTPVGGSTDNGSNDLSTHPNEHLNAQSSLNEETKGGGVFSGWGFDVNSVTGNMGISNLFSTSESVGGLFASPESMGNLFTPSDTEQSGDLPEAEDSDAIDDKVDNEDLGVSAAHLASAATLELENASRAAQETIGKAAEELGRGWGTFNTFLDDMLSPENHGGEQEPDGAHDIHTTFRKLFPDLDTDDEVVDHYRCTMLQKYRCYLNNATPEKALPLRGRLFVTTSNIAMYVTEDGGAFGGRSFVVTIPFQDVVKIQKGARAMLRVITNAQPQASYIFAEFESETHYSGALSLLEQLNGAASGNGTATGLVVEGELDKSKLEGAEEPATTD